ncbi:MAG: hypothetical protein Q9227_002445 [Pyrenula ochraceoflavens]
MADNYAPPRGRYLRCGDSWGRTCRTCLAGSDKFVCNEMLVEVADKFFLENLHATANLKVALIESQDLAKARDWTAPVDQFSNRVSSITPSSQSLLESVGAWRHIDYSRIQPYDEMKVWDGSNGSSIQFDWSSEAARYGSLARSIATMVENANLTRALLTRLSELDDIQASIFSNTTVTSIANGTDTPDGFNLSSWPTLSLSQKSSSDENPIRKRITARLLIGADGPSSPVRTYTSISSPGWDYSRHGIVATLKLEQTPHHISSTPKIAYQRFLPALGGPIALLPLPPPYASLVWSTHPHHAAYLKSLPLDAFTTLLNAAFRLSPTDLSYLLSLPPTTTSTTYPSELAWRLPHTPPTSPLFPPPPPIASVLPGTPASFPLRFRHASTYISPRTALLGDAAHSIHPLAGQGLNLGLADARALHATILDAVTEGADIGDMRVLQRYNQERWGRNAAVGGVCDALHWIYSVEGNGVGSWMRGMGVRGLERMGRVKEWVMGRAGGG